MNSAISTIIVQFAEEAAFLWLLRDGAVRAPHYLLADLARLDHRIEAQLDGLRECGDEAWTLVKTEAESGDPGAVFAAANLATQDRNEERLKFVIEIGAANPQAARGLVSSLGWRSPNRVMPLVQDLCASQRPAIKRIGIAASAAHRQKPKLDLPRALGAAEPPLLAGIFKAAGELGLAEAAVAAKAFLAHDDPLVAFRAAWAAALLTGDPAALAALVKVAQQGGAYAEQAAALAARRLEAARALDWLKQLAKTPQTARTAIVVAGALGDPAAVGWLIEQMERPPLARKAGEAFCLITGAHLAYEKLEAPPPDDFQSGPTEDPADENVALDPDEHLYWPDPPAVRKWQRDRANNFTPGVRHLLGKPLNNPEVLREALRVGYQRQRAAAALELAVRRPEGGLFPIAAPGFRQQI